MLESILQRKIKNHLEIKYGAVCFKHTGGPFAQVGISDLICCLPKGKYLALEVKTEKCKATATQLHFIYRVKSVGGIAGIVRSVKDVDKLILDNLDKV